MFDCFLKIEGVDGESKDAQHADAIEVVNWSWGASQPGTMHSGGGGGTGKASFGDISVAKYVDKASPTLWKNLASGKHFESGKLTVRKAGGEQLEYLVIELKKILVASINVGGNSGNEDRLMETVALNFAEFKISYTPQKDDGTGDAAIDFAWSIEENAEK
ncbi:Hcp family type VI secretion system effector [Spiribacter halobius]|uniref:Type VI secretion system tube protein Hcp n=1 Tax=Sediminicurvatus halobius TaxID=2182432 RepID=A0A2U2N2G7_9GAMM|nr:type VI secretion system tube protein Hcp [Spiribacter halobius]PWG63263.1 type VI secretion system tube protein Hcp [Spiribacter halobius]UEX76665.1 type VI secretion system tube protein Hcp [Spiribacter halobius]